MELYNKVVQVQYKLMKVAACKILNTILRPYLDSLKPFILVYNSCHQWPVHVCVCV